MLKNMVSRIFRCKKGTSENQKESKIRRFWTLKNATVLKGQFMEHLKGTVSPDYKCLEVISIKSPLLGHVTPDI